MAKTANGWKSCSRGHKWRGPGGCPKCWPGKYGKAAREEALKALL